MVRALIFTIEVGVGIPRRHDQQYEENLAQNYSERSKKLTLIEHPLCTVHSHFCLSHADGIITPTSEMQKLRLQGIKKCIQVHIAQNGRTI